MGLWPTYYNIRWAFGLKFLERILSSILKNNCYESLFYGKAFSYLGHKHNWHVILFAVPHILFSMIIVQYEQKVNLIKLGFEQIFEVRVLLLLWPLLKISGFNPKKF